MAYSSRHLAEFYEQLGTMIEAGVSIVKALRTAERNTPRPLRLVSRQLADACEAGTPLHLAMQDRFMKFDRLDCQTVTISEQSGMLDAGLKSLARYHDLRAIARRKLITASILPSIILSAAVFISRLPKLVLAMFGQGQYSIGRYLIDTVGLLAAIAGVIVLGRMAFRWVFTIPVWNVAAERFVRCLPVIGRLRFDYALSQWLSSMRMMLNAGMGMIQALELASRNSPSPLLRDAHDKFSPLLGSHMDVSEALRTARLFPEDLLQMWATGEQSGKMDDMLDRLARMYEDRWRRSIEVFAAWLPRVAYVFVALFIIVQIFMMLEPIVQMYRDALSW
jgi:type IV pilus assembly protein PilC